MKHYALVLAAALAVATFSTAFASVPTNGVNKKIEWSTITTWSTEVKPLRAVASLDNKKVFVLGEDHKVHVFTPDGTLLGSIAVDEGVTDIDISPYGEAVYLMNSADKTFSAITVSLIADLKIGNSPVKGPENAPVTIFVFTDFQCPYCKRLPPIVDQVLKNNPDTVKLVLKNFPLTRIHPMAESAAIAALAAKNQGKFWEYHDMLFSSPQLNQAIFEQLAMKLGLDMKKFKQDMSSMPVRAQLTEDMQMAEQAEVSGTPTCFVNGRKVQERSVEGFQKLIDEVLEGQKQE